MIKKINKEELDSIKEVCINLIKETLNIELDEEKNKNDETDDILLFLSDELNFGVDTKNNDNELEINDKISGAKQLLNKNEAKDKINLFDLTSNNTKKKIISLTDFYMINEELLYNNNMKKKKIK